MILPVSALATNQMLSIQESAAIPSQTVPISKLVAKRSPGTRLAKSTALCPICSEIPATSMVASASRNPPVDAAAAW